MWAIARLGDPVCSFFYIDEYARAEEKAETQYGTRNVSAHFIKNECVNFNSKIASW
jgi:hypothetical protein